MKAAPRPTEGVSRSAMQMPTVETLDPLSPDEQAKMNRDGYLLLEDVLSPEVVASLLESLHVVVEHARRTHGLVHEDYYHKNSFKVSEVLRRSSSFDSLIDHPGFFGRILGLMGPYIQVMGSEIFVRGPADDSAITNFHTDLGPCLQSVIPNDDSVYLQLKAQLFLTDLSEPDASNFALVPGSHRVRVTDSDEYCVVRSVDQRVGDDGALPPDVVQVLARPGDVLVFPHSLWHGVARNRSGRTRYSISLRYGQTALRPHERYDSVLTDRRRVLTDRQRRLLGDFGAHQPNPYRPHRQAQIMAGHADDSAR